MPQVLEIAEPVVAPAPAISSSSNPYEGLNSLQILRLQDRQRVEAQQTSVSAINAENPEDDANDYMINEEV